MKVQLLRGDDWIGVYVDGELKCEGHSVDYVTLLTLAGVAPEVLWVEGKTPWDVWGGRCPETWAQVEAGAEKEGGTDE